MDDNAKKVAWIIIGIYLLIANIVAVVLTIHDKRAAMRHDRRIPEATLLITAALSGCVFEYLTMRIVHHKTQHPKFMIGIPVIFALEVIASIILLIAFH